MTHAIFRWGRRSAAAAAVLVLLAFGNFLSREFAAVQPRPPTAEGRFMHSHRPDAAAAAPMEAGVRGTLELPHSAPADATVFVAHGQTVTETETVVSATQRATINADGNAEEMGQEDGYARDNVVDVFAEPRAEQQLDDNIVGATTEAATKVAAFGNMDGEVASDLIISPIIDAAAQSARTADGTSVLAIVPSATGLGTAEEISKLADEVDVLMGTATAQTTIELQGSGAVESQADKGDMTEESSIQIAEVQAAIATKLLMKEVSEILVAPVSVDDETAAIESDVTMLGMATDEIPQPDRNTGDAQLVQQGEDLSQGLKEGEQRLGQAEGEEAQVVGLVDLERSAMPTAAESVGE